MYLTEHEISANKLFANHFLDEDKVYAASSASSYDNKSGGELREKGKKMIKVSSLSDEIKFSLIDESHYIYGSKILQVRELLKDKFTHVEATLKPPSGD